MKIRRAISYNLIAGVVLSTNGFELTFLIPEPEKDRGDLRIFSYCLNLNFKMSYYF